MRVRCVELTKSTSRVRFAPYPPPRSSLPPLKIVRGSGVARAVRFNILRMCCTEAVSQFRVSSRSLLHCTWFTLSTPGMDHSAIRACMWNFWCSSRPVLSALPRCTVPVPPHPPHPRRPPPPPSCLFRRHLLLYVYMCVCFGKGWEGGLSDF